MGQMALRVLGSLLGGLDLQVFVADVKPQPPIQTHVQIGEPHQSKPCQEKPAPSEQQQTKTSQRHKKRCDVMAKAVLAGEKMEEFSLIPAATISAFFFAPLAGVASDFFVGKGPGDGGNGNGEDRQLQELLATIIHADARSSGLARFSGA
jgi:hypothetical protein